MDGTLSYQVFGAPNSPMQLVQDPLRRRQAPLVWQAGAVDEIAINVLKAFFRTGRRPHFRDLPKALLATGEMYNDPHLLAEPERFYRPVEAPSPQQTSLKTLTPLPQGRRMHLRFRSRYETYDPTYQRAYDAFAGNEFVHARLWLHEGPPRPTVICMHGWGGGALWLEERIFGAADLYRAGLNVVVTVLPFHGKRHPHGTFGLNLFPSSDLQRTYEGFGQAVADVRSMMLWLVQQGIADRVGYIGYSLGGYVGALLASLHNDLDFLVPIITPVSMADLLWEVELDTNGVREAEEAGFDLMGFRSAFALHCPLTYQLNMPKNRVLLIGGRGDRVVPPQQVHALWEHWGRPPIEWFAGGHYLHFGRSNYFKKICALAAPPVQIVDEPRGAKWPWMSTATSSRFH